MKKNKWKVKKAGRSPTRFVVERWQDLWREKRGTFDSYEKAQRYADELNAILEHEYSADNGKVKG